MVTLQSPAKVNLCLDILKKDPSGYHELSTVLCIAPNLHDTIQISNKKDSDDLSILLGTENITLQRLPNEEPHLLIRTLDLLRAHTGTKKFAQITIHKNIPFSSGLGGLSSNAAMLLKGLNQLWNLGLTKGDLSGLASQLGMDIAFFLQDAPICHATHYGEILTPITTNLTFDIEITPRSSADLHKTANAFASLNLRKCGHDTEKTAALIKALEANNSQAQVFQNLDTYLHNDFTQLYENKSLTGPAGDQDHLPSGHHLAGAGPSTFTLKGFI